MVVAEVGEVGAAVDAVRDLDPDVLVLDLKMPGRSSLDALAELPAPSADQDPDADDGERPSDRTAGPGRRRGGLRAQGGGRPELVQACAPPRPAAPSIRRSARRSPHPKGERTIAHLSARELEVLRFIALGHANAEIAALLGLSLRTVDAHGAHVGPRPSGRRARSSSTLALRAGLLDRVRRHGMPARHPLDRGGTMPTRIGINGFGRHRPRRRALAVERGADLEIVAVNDVADPRPSPACSSRPVYGRFGAGSERRRGSRRGAQDPRARRARPGRAAWAEQGVDVVVEASGSSRTREPPRRIGPAPARSSSPPRPRARAGGRQHRARRELPRAYDPERHHIVTPPRARPLRRADDQGAARDGRHPAWPHGHGARLHRRPKLLDGPHKDLRRARAGASTSSRPRPAPRGRRLVLPELAGRLDGFAVRVPVADRLARRPHRRAERPTTAAEVNAAFASAPTRPLEGTSPTARTRSCPPTSSARRPRRSSTPR